jgi:NADPH:quinone reductase-like Zn-dependent oxidoreductase
MPSSPIDFQVNRDKFSDVRFDAGAQIDDLTEGQVLFKVNAFALTSNNISYAAAGDMLNYWGFFPGPDRWGRIPAMGFADVLASRNSEVTEGARVFGFFPMSRHLVIDAQPTKSGMIDGVAHRAEHAPIYRTYSYTDRDGLYDANLEAQIMLLRGLFMTSFLVDDLFADEDFYGAGASIITSASSKTSIALAHLGAARARGPVIGLTSKRNQDFVRKLGCYDEVVLYDELDRLTERVPAAGAVMTDMAGNGEVVAGVHERLQDNLKYSCTVGGTHWDSPPRKADLPGPTPEFFFAPSRIVKRTQDWGAGGLQEKLGTSWRAFASFSNQWMNVQHHAGEEALERVYQEVLSGALNPSDGHVISLW